METLVVMDISGAPGNHTSSKVKVSASRKRCNDAFLARKDVEVQRQNDDLEH